MKHKIETTSPDRVRKRLTDAGLNPDDFIVGPMPAAWNDENLDGLIKQLRPEHEFRRRVIHALSGGCCGD